mgnify:CR=1 FL=1
MKPYATVDRSQFPLVYVRFTGNEPGHENFTAYLAELSALYEDHVKLAIVFDAREAILPGLKYQKLQANWLKGHWDTMRSYCLGTAYVIENTAVRGILRMIFAIQKQPVPYEVSSTLEEGMAWARQRLIKE